MPCARCPVCDDLFHLAVRGTSLEEWEREHVRERDPNGTPLLPCIRCWVELRPGHRVTIRSIPEGAGDALAVGQEGVVESVEEGRLLVRLGAALGAFRREALFYVPGQPSPPVATEPSGSS